MAVKVETEMRTAVEAWRASDEEREQRLAAVDQTMQQIELVAAHAHRARGLLPPAKVPV
jgi:ferric-dicitrate binding protein FerR (iron transport regulator)